MKTGFGSIYIANIEPFSTHINGFGISPLLQEKLVYLGQFEVYDQAAELAQSLLGINISSSQIYRLTNHYGQAIEPDLKQMDIGYEKFNPEDVVYAQADGAMLLTDNGYKENKLARMFSADALKGSVVEDRGGYIESSLYVTHLGSSSDFTAKLKPHMDRYKRLGSNLVFISDGAIWLRQMMEEHYPDATLILDMYHAMSYVGEVANAAFAKRKKASEWIENQRNLLLNGEVRSVLANIKKLKIPKELLNTTYKYLDSNSDRMNYHEYRKRGLLIGSGAIESAHRTVVQKRCKRSGQRWSMQGAQRVLNLRVCWMSGSWDIVKNKIEPYSQFNAA